MAAPRLLFLYPNLLRSVRSCEPTPRSLRLPTSYNSPASPAGFHSSRRCDQDAYPRRYGPANESRLPPPSLPNQPGPGSTGKDVFPPAQRGPTSRDPAQAQDPRNSAKEDQSETNKSLNSVNSSSAKSPDEQPSESASQNADDFETAPPEQRDEEHEAPEDDETENPLDTVLQMPSPSSQLTPSGVSGPEGRRTPPLAPPPYVHHFDTYSLVKDLEKGGFSEAQAVTLMKAIRGILQEKLEFARRTLTSKSDIENEQYLFKAACSELQSAMQTSRNAEIQRQRTSRTHLQHEVDILSQRMNQELASLNDDLKEMFNDHRMTIKEMQRSLDTAIQELNYKITVSLNSDGKSEVEGLRWILTRRAALAIATSAIMIILFLKYYSVHTHARKMKEAAAAEAAVSEPLKNVGVQTEPSLSGTLVTESLG
ncbi:hypothetical protein VTN77DRAFT_5457 [Rasamsonia byssochlamydoides]|uniref:uncharacterized protein n=1 Tax=Rasamsonia byssochlamydoides TaxID=89139 RepID=UPI003743A150